MTIEAVGVLVQGGVDVNLGDLYMGWTPVHFARSGEMVHLLVEHGSDVFATDKVGENALHSACGKGFVSVVKALLEHSLDVNCHSSIAISSILKDAFSGNHAMIEVLLDHEAAIDDGAVMRSR